MKAALLVIAALCALSAASAQSNPCNLLRNATACDAAPAGCIWCKCKAIPSGCFTPAQAAKLPPGVFVCNKPSLMDVAMTEEESPVEGNIPIKNCGTSSDLVSGLSVSTNPDPPTKGKPLTVSLSGSLSAGITSGSVKYVISFIGIPVVTKTNDICDLTTCPVSAGSISWDLHQDIPSAIPSGSYGLKATGTSNAGDLFCFTTTLNVA